MIKGEYKKILFEVFDVLGFFDDEKERALEGFKKKFAGELLRELDDSLSDYQRRWLAEVTDKKEYDKNDPTVVEIQKSITLAYPGEEFYKKSRQIFKNILTSYVEFMSKKISRGKSEKLANLLDNI